MARVQMRIGPNRVGRFGSLQLIADAVEEWCEHTEVKTKCTCPDEMRSYPAQFRHYHSYPENPFRRRDPKYLFGCPPTPEALTHGIITLQKKIRGETLDEFLYFFNYLVIKILVNTSVCSHHSYTASPKGKRYLRYSLKPADPDRKQIITIKTHFTEFFGISMQISNDWFNFSYYLAVKLDL